MMEVEIMDVIKVKTNRGKGTGDDPMRTVTAYFTTDGTKICEQDPLEDNRNRERQYDVYAKAISSIGEDQ